MELKLTGNRLGRLQYGWALYQGLRPWAYTASIVPMLLAIVLAWRHGSFSIGNAVLIIVGGLAIHSGVNVFNYCWDPRVMSKARLVPEWRRMRRLLMLSACGFYLLATLVGAYFSMGSGWQVLAIGLVGLVGGYFYSAPPVNYQDKGLAFVMVFFLMGPLMVVGAYYALTATASWDTVFVSLPIAALVASILISDEMRDIESDGSNGVRTFTVRAGYEAAKGLYFVLLFLAFGSTLLLVTGGLLPPTAVIVILSLPIVKRTVRWVNAPAEDRPAFTVGTANIHLVFGLLLTLALLLG